MKRMVTEEEIISLIQKYAPGFDPSDIEAGDILQNAVLGIDEDGDIVKGDLFGKYVRIITPPSSDVLSADQQEIFAEGVFIKGDYLGFKNPIFLPQTSRVGLMIGKVAGFETDTIIHVYNINGIGKIQVTGTGLLLTNSGVIDITGQIRINGKVFPTLPDSPASKHYLVGKGTGIYPLSWQEGNGLYLHTVVFDVGAGQTFTIRLISDSPDTCAVDSVSGNFTIPNSTFIQPANMGHVVITPFDENEFAPDIYAFDSATGAFTNQITLSSVTSDTVTPVG